MREERFAEDGTAVNVYDSDVEDSLKTVLFRKKTFKMYDSYAYSSLTDDLPVKNDVHFNKIGSNLKAETITSFRREFAKMFDDLREQKEKEKEIAVDLPLKKGVKNA